MNQNELSKTDLILTRRAIRNDWQISADARGKIVSEMIRIVSSSASDRERIGAAKVLIAADAVNVKRESLDLQAERKSPPERNRQTHRVLILPANGRESVSIHQELQARHAIDREYRMIEVTARVPLTMPVV